MSSTTKNTATWTDDPMATNQRTRLTHKNFKHSKNFHGLCVTFVKSLHWSGIWQTVCSTTNLHFRNTKFWKSIFIEFSGHQSKACSRWHTASTTYWWKQIKIHLRNFRRALGLQVYSKAQRLGDSADTAVKRQECKRGSILASPLSPISRAKFRRKT